METKRRGGDRGLLLLLPSMSRSASRSAALSGVRRSLLKKDAPVFFCALAFGLIGPLAGQTEPPVCQVVTADQIGSDGLNTASIQQQIDACGAADDTTVAVELSADQAPASPPARYSWRAM